MIALKLITAISVIAVKKKSCYQLIVVVFNVLYSATNIQKLARVINITIRSEHSSRCLTIAISTNSKPFHYETEISFKIDRLSNTFPAPTTTVVRGSSATVIGRQVTSRSNVSRFFKRAPPPARKRNWDRTMYILFCLRMDTSTTGSELRSFPEPGSWLDPGMPLWSEESAAPVEHLPG